ncbi:hypothetical protein BJ742DRAFT_825020 [Cladochytrium replicatum]|nr:hypothetical protein BJ742DRAFT_825020 [Cladochytrium replicatum]
MGSVELFKLELLHSKWKLPDDSNYRAILGDRMTPAKLETRIASVNTKVSSHFASAATISISAKAIGIMGLLAPIVIAAVLGVKRVLPTTILLTIWLVLTISFGILSRVMGYLGRKKLESAVERTQRILSEYTASDRESIGVHWVIKNSVDWPDPNKKREFVEIRPKTVYWIEVQVFPMPGQQNNEPISVVVEIAMIEPPTYSP